MAYPTGMLSLTLEDVDRRALSLKGYAQRRHDEMAAGNVPSTTVIDVFARLRAERVALAAASQVSGLAAYARTQKNNEQLDVVAEFNGMLAAIDATTSWIAGNFPVDGTSHLLAQTLGANGPVDRQFSAAQTAGLRTALQGLIATIA